MAVVRNKFGRYELVRTLGVGGMAQTFMALRFFRIGDEEVSRPVCLKQVLPIYNQDEDFLHLFHREAKLAIQLQHPNIVKVQDFGEVDGVHFMELELVDGVDLLALLQSQGGRLPTDVIKQLGLDIAAALKYAHNHVPQDTGGGLTPGRRGIIHRDISPSNILISQRGDIKLTDFGIAKALSGSATAKASRAPLGKLPYMAPERFNRKLPTDGRADLFSLGIVLFECAGGLRPYDGEDDSETIGNIIAGAPRGLSEEAPDLDQALCAVIEKLIAPKLEDRTPDAGALIEQFHEIPPSPRARSVLAKMVGEALATRGPIDKTPTSGTAELPPSEPVSIESPQARTDGEGDSVSPPVAAVGDVPQQAIVQPAPRPRPDASRPPPEPPPNPWKRRLVLAALGVLLLGGLGLISYLILAPSEPEGAIVTNPGPQSNTEGDVVALQVEAEDPDGDALTYDTQELPPGLSINRRGVIRGRVASTSAGVYDVTLTVDNGKKPVSEKFTWTVEAPADVPTPRPVDPPVPPPRPDASVPPPASSHGWVKVVVIPWGKAWIDGRPYRAGSNGYMRVREGTRVVKAGQDKLSNATATQRVTVKGGRKKKVNINLMD